MKSAQQVSNTKTYEVAVRTGLLAYGVVYLLVAWIALQLAWGKSDQEASQQGALRELAEKPFGGFLLWVVAIGLFALTTWKVFELVYGRLDTKKKVSAVGRAVVYVVIAVSAIRVATGSGGSGSGQQRTISARLMENAAGRVLVVVVGLGIAAIGVYLVRKAITKKFTEDLTGGVSRQTIRLGQIGYTAKGVVFVIVGGLFAWAALAYDPEKAGGLDTALHTVKGKPFGPYLLTILALGLVCFAAYTFVWSRHARRG